MPDITRKRTGELLRIVFEILFEYPEGLQAAEVLKTLRSKIKLSEYESGTYQSGALRIDKIVRFATVDCVKAGWLAKQKGKWSITEEGRQAYERFTDPEKFYKEAVRLYHEWKQTRQETELQTLTDTQREPEENATVTYEQAEEQAWQEIEQYLRSMPPYEFQEMVASLLRAMGYYVSWVAPAGKDGGVDILAWADPLGTKPPRIKVQVKRRSDNIDVEGLRAFMALLAQDEVGIFVTTGGFTRDAEIEARIQQNRKLTLINLEKLFDLWVENYAKLDDSARRKFPLQPIYFLAPQT